MTVHLPLSTKERKQLFKHTSAAPRVIENLLRGVTSDQMIVQPNGEFSLHEHVWHLADLESEGFRPRLLALLNEDYPQLANFDGDLIAQQRNYHSLPLQQAFFRFSETRLQNLWLLSGIGHADWMRRGEQAGLGEVCLADVFRAMAAHDFAHIQTIEAQRKGKPDNRSSTAAA